MWSHTIGLKEVKKAVESLVNQSIRPFEIIVVDNGSNPPLRMTPLPRISQIRLENEIGLSNARNRGIGIANGDYVGFIDDDCIADKHWIEDIQKGIRAGGEVLGGPLKPRFKAIPPAWWSERDLGYFVGVGNAKTQDIWGGNMVFKKEVFKKIGFFDSRVGRQKGKLLAGEDSYLISKGKGIFKILFVPTATVFHLVPSQRLTFSYIMRWSFNSGKSQRIAYGRPSLMVFYHLIKAFMEWLNPFSRSSKSSKIQKVAVMMEQMGTIL